jgi:hypothetical protein
MATSHVEHPQMRRPPAHSLSSSSLRVGHCYAAKEGEVRKIVAFDGGLVLYVVEYRGAFPVWDKRRWCSTTRPVFASEVEREVQ